MGFYIKITKSHEDDDVVHYNFSPDGHNFGKIEVSKSTGEMVSIEPMKGDERGLFVSRAAARLKQVIKDDVYPESAEWAS